MDTVELDLGPRSYRIFIGAGLLDDEALLSSCVEGRQAFVVTNETIAPVFLDRVKASLSAFQVDTMTLPDGEQYKTLSSMNDIVTGLLRHRHNRGTTVIALGGGVVGDTAGFAAACYQRGVSLIQMPTTLLAQVDSSVGGKTAVNHELGKNMIGAFHQPRAVIIDTDTLETLPGRELTAGLAEVIKHGVLADAGFFAWLEDHMEDLRRLDKAGHAIKRSCEIKAAVVAGDERETGNRALLNLGHTFAHAIENGLGYGQWLHGEAVGAGLVMAGDLAVRLGMCTATDCLRIKALVEKAGLPVCPPAELTAETMLNLMGLDKKVSDRGMKFVLPRGLGSAEIVEGVDVQLVMATLNAGAGLGESAAGL